MLQDSSTVRRHGMVLSFDELDTTLCSHFHGNSLPMGFLQMFGHLVGGFETVPTALKVLYLSDIERWFLR